MVWIIHLGKWFCIYDAEGFKRLMYGCLKEVRIECREKEAQKKPKKRRV